MSDPTELTPLPRDIGEMLEVERRRPEPAAGDLGRVWTRIAKTADLPDGGPEGGGPDGDASAPTDTGPGVSTDPGTAVGAAGAGEVPGALAKLAGAAITPATLVAFAVGAGVGAGTHALLQRPVEPRAAIERKAPDPPRAEPPAPVVAADEAPPKTTPPASVTPPHERPPRARATRARRPRSAALAAERALIETARTALARRRPQDALEALSQHRRRHPRGQLAEEREALFVVGLANLGRYANAREHARRFRRRYPKSLLLPVVEEAVEERPARPQGAR